MLQKINARTFSSIKNKHYVIGALTLYSLNVKKFHTVSFGKTLFDAEFLYFYLSFNEKLLKKIELYRSPKEIK